MKSDSVAESASDEWTIETGVGSFGQDFTISKPCQLRFIGETDQDTEKFTEALDSHGYSRLDPDADRSKHGHRPYYDGEVVDRDNYHRLRILVFRGGVVRLYPRDGYVPPAEKLELIVDALETGFDAELEHDPIPRNDSSKEDN
jgi:hypothetical protein